MPKPVQVIGNLRTVNLKTKVAQNESVEQYLEIKILVHSKDESVVDLMNRMSQVVKLTVDNIQMSLNESHD